MKHWNALTKFLTKHSQKYTIILVGDLNKTPPPKWDLKLWHTGLNSFHALSQLLIAARGGVGRYDHSAGSHVSQQGMTNIDYIVGPSIWEPQLVCTKCHLGLLGSDHLPIQSIWKGISGAHRHPPTPKLRLRPMDISSIAQDVIQSLTTDPPDTLEHLSDYMHQAMAKLVRHTQTGNRIPMAWVHDNKFRHFRKQSRTLMKEYKKAKSRAGFERLQDHKKTIKQFCLEIRNRYWQKILKQLTQDVTLDPWSYFRTCKSIGALSNHSAGKMTAVVDESGAKLTGLAASVAQGAFFEKIVSPRPGHDQGFITRMQQIIDQGTSADELRRDGQWGDLMNPVSPDEVKWAITHQRSHTATGPDNIPMTVWKAMGRDLGFIQTLALLFTKVLATGIFPQTWKDNWLVPIPKVPHPTKLADWRGIAITNSSYRIFMAIIQKRVSRHPAMTEVLRNEQFGFRPGRCTSDAVACLMESIQRRSRNTPKLETYVFFIDLKQAYDSVHPLALGAALRQHGLPRKFVDLMMSLYYSCDGRIRNYDNSETRFHGSCGLRQGCPNSPTMFLFVVDSLIRKLDRGPACWIPGVTTRDVNDHNGGQFFLQAWYADDGAVMAQSRYALQKQIDTTVEWSKEWGLTINHSKCVAMLFTGDHKPIKWSVNIEGNEVTQQTSFLYLGCSLNTRTSAIEMGTYRLKIALANIKSLETMCRRLWYASKEVRQRACQAIVEGTMLYASELWSKGSLIWKARRIQGRMAQLILGSSSTSSRIANSLELNLTDFEAIIRARRLKWMWRVLQTASPTRALVATIRDKETVMGRMRIDVRACSLPTMQFMILPHSVQQIIVRNWSDMIVRGFTHSENLTTYLSRYWHSPGNQVANVSLTLVPAERAFHIIRMGGFLWSHRAARILKIARQNEGCACCNSRETESASHMFLRCPTWRNERRAILGDMIKEIRTDPTIATKITQVLLGGRAGRHKEDKFRHEVHVQTLLFLSEVIPKRRKIMQTKGLRVSGKTKTPGGDPVTTYPLMG